MHQRSEPEAFKDVPTAALFRKLAGQKQIMCNERLYPFHELWFFFKHYSIADIVFLCVLQMLECDEAGLVSRAADLQG